MLASENLIFSQFLLCSEPRQWVIGILAIKIHLHAFVLWSLQNNFFPLFLPPPASPFFFSGNVSFIKIRIKYQLLWTLNKSSPPYYKMCEFPGSSSLIGCLLLGCSYYTLLSFIFTMSKTLSATLPHPIKF